LKIYLIYNKFLIYKKGIAERKPKRKRQRDIRKITIYVQFRSQFQFRVRENVPVRKNKEEINK